MSIREKIHKGLIRLGEWEKKKISEFIEARKKDVEFRREIERLEREAYLEEKRRLAKLRGKRKARSEAKRNETFIQFPDLWGDLKPLRRNHNGE